MSPKIFSKSLDLTFATNDGPVHALKDVNLDINEGDFVRVNINAVILSPRIS